jgi:cytochrome c oxidase subunit IV
MSQGHNNSNEPAHVEHHEGHVIVPYKILRNVAIALLCLTVLTVTTSRFHLGWAAAPVAFLIAFIKAMLVMMYFMGLKFDSVLNRVIFSLGFFFLAVFYLFTALDVFTRIKEFSTL